MSKKLIIDAVALQQDPNVKGMVFNPGSHQKAFESPVGQEIYKAATSRFGVTALIGAITSAPSRPPVVALELLIFRLVGEDGFTDEMKKMTGRLVRFVVEHLGGRWVRRGVKTTVSSRYSSGSIYSLTVA